MEVRVQKWGNSLALRIPKPLAIEIGIKDKSPVRLLLRNGRLTISPAPRPSASLKCMLRKVTKKNIHSEVNTSHAVGDEAW